MLGVRQELTDWPFIFALEWMAKAMSCNANLAVLKIFGKHGLTLVRCHQPRGYGQPI